MIRAVPILALLLSMAFPFLAPPAPAHAEACQFVLGFKTLHDLIPGFVGDCLVDEHHNPDNGDGLQETTGPTGAGGLLVWRKADNWTAYTDGYHTWVNGPYGLRERLNTECFAWEAGCLHPIPSNPSTTVTFSSVTGASPGGRASVTVQTSPNAVCVIDYWGPNGRDRYEFGALHVKRADSNGVVSWSWLIAPNTPSGNGTVTVSCDGATASTPIQIGSTPVTVTFTSVTGAAPGGTASVTIQTVPNAVCRIDYFGPMGRDRFEAGALHPDVADANGVASWSWHIAGNTPTGNGTVVVRCNGVTAQTTIPIT